MATSGTRERLRLAVVTRACLGVVPQTLRADESDDWHYARRMTDAGGLLLGGRAAGVSWMKAWWINELSWEWQVLYQRIDGEQATCALHTTVFHRRSGRRG